MHVAYLHYLYGRDTALHHVEQFAAGARQLGHRVDVHAMNLAPAPAKAGASAEKPALRARLRQGLKRRFGRWLHDPKELWWNLAYIRREKALLREARPDLLLVRSQGLGFSCVRVARALDLPLLLEINAPAEESSLYIPHYVHWTRVRAAIGRYKLRQADGLMVVSTALKQYYVENFGVDPAKIAVVPNGADVDRFRPDTAPDPAFPRDPDRPRIGYVGSFQAWHALDRLGRLIAEVAEDRPQSRFLMVGDGDGVAALRREAPLPEERLAFTGRVDHGRVPGLVASLDIGILAEAAPYQCPLKVVEWLAAGKAVVAPAYGPLRELLEDGRQGLLFPPGDWQAMRAAILRLIDDPELRRRLGEAAAERAQATMSWRDNARAVLAAGEAAIARHRARRGGP